MGLTRENEHHTEEKALTFVWDRADDIHLNSDKKIPHQARNGNYKSKKHGSSSTIENSFFKSNLDSLSSLVSPLGKCPTRTERSRSENNSQLKNEQGETEKLSPLEKHPTRTERIRSEENGQPKNEQSKTEQLSPLGKCPQDNGAYNANSSLAQ